MHIALLYALLSELSENDYQCYIYSIYNPQLPFVGIERFWILVWKMRILNMRTTRTLIKVSRIC